MMGIIGTPEECIRWLFNQDRTKQYEIKELPDWELERLKEDWHG
jgi:hypothetical protein